MVLNRSFDRALEVVAELEASLVVALDEAGHGGCLVDGMLFRVRVQARDVEDVLREPLAAIRGPLVGTYGPALDSARDLVDALGRVYLLALDVDGERRSAFVRSIDYALAYARVFGTALELAAERGPGGRPTLELVRPPQPAPVLDQVARVARVLPLRGRARERKELDAELRELAQADVPRWTQLVHALRVAARMWLLPRALLTPLAALELAT